MKRLQLSVGWNNLISGESVESKYLPHQFSLACLLRAFDAEDAHPSQPSGVGLAHHF